MKNGNSNPSKIASLQGAALPTRRQALAGAVITLGGLALGSSAAWAAAHGAVAGAIEGEIADEIAGSAESIHQEPVFKASRQRVYAALTDAKQFNKVMELSAAMQSHMASGGAAAEIGGGAGESFSLFGGYISGRQIELIPNQRIVEAWRTGGWEPGIYSIARFELVEQGAETKIVFDHTGFPRGQAKHLAEGWHVNYWEPLAKVLA